MLAYLYVSIEEIFIKIYYISFKKTRLYLITPLKIQLVNLLKVIKKILNKDFFSRHSSIVAPELIGCLIVRLNNGVKIQEGIIVETEAYSQEEEACHGFSKRTEANQTLFGEPGLFYVYRSYGIHHCLNLVTDKNYFASGVLIRSVFINQDDERVASGPGLLTKKFQIDTNLNSLKSYNNNLLRIFNRHININDEDLVQTTRIGISKAVDLKWRWYLKKSRSVSKRAKGDKNPKLQINYKI